MDMAKTILARAVVALVVILVGLIVSTIFIHKFKKAFATNS